MGQLRFAGGFARLRLHGSQAINKRCTDDQQTTVARQQRAMLLRSLPAWRDIRRNPKSVWQHKCVASDIPIKERRRPGLMSFLERKEATALTGRP
jgi:hypothetical protein